MFCVYASPVSDYGGGLKMELNSLICREAEYILEHRSTIRETGKAFGRGKSTVHKDLREKLPYINSALAKEVANLLRFNIQERARRGGISTREKFYKTKTTLTEL